MNDPNGLCRLGDRWHAFYRALRQGHTVERERGIQSLPRRFTAQPANQHRSILAVAPMDRGVVL
jgi:hypothetical protein